MHLHAEFIRNRYAAVHGARPSDFPAFLSRMRSPGVGAALGYRRASAGPLFLEAYLDEPIEDAVGRHLGASVSRDRIVEVGSLAANSPLAMVGLWYSAADEL